jgi:hypothetical protein
MELNIDRVRKLVKSFAFTALFIEELGWDHYDGTLEILPDGRPKKLRAIAQKRGMAAYLCVTPSGEKMPDHPFRRKIEQQVAKATHEHLIIFTDEMQTTQVWQWVRREPGKPLACREHTFHKSQPGDALIQKLKAIAFSLEEEETLTLFEVTRRARTGFDVEKVTKRFYDRFKKEHTAFLEFVTGITEKTDHEWYASVMLNRLMFVYFIQCKGFLDSDTDYLRNRLARMRRDYGKDKFYSFYRYFLLRLFHEGLGGKTRTQELEALLGKIPYFDGGFFERHPVEQRYPDINIPDEAFERIFDYFDQYQWHLDERPLRADNEINPDVLGYIFEKYINQKQMGAYYTKEDITEYISKNTVIPFLFDAARVRCKVAFDNPGGPTVWKMLSNDPDRYIYPAVKHGVIRGDGSVLPEADLPDFVRTGMHDPNARMFDQRYNLQQAPADDPTRLVTETWREYVYRRNRCLEVREKLLNGEMREINDLITLNLDIRQFSQDVIENCEGPELLRAFWHSINGHIPEKSNEKYQAGISILDPTCGSGAFLFAALNILEPLYEACLDRMAAFVEDLDRSEQKHRPEKLSDFRNVLKRIEDHPNRRYFIFKSIILNNLFGVDIMEEAVEICKLRLFLKLVAQVEPDPARENLGIEPLPDIDFNIRAGNTLVGYATADEVRKVFKEESDGQSRLQFSEVLSGYQKFEEQVEETDRAFKLFRVMQTDREMDAKDFANAKQALRDRLKAMDDELNRHLAGEYGVNVPSPSGRGAEGEGDAYDNWLKSHQPFHWFVEFYGIMQSGGFDVIIGNPPYVEYTKVRNIYSLKNYETLDCSNLYAFISDRSLSLLNKRGSFGFIVPISIICTQRMRPIQDRISSVMHSVWFSNYAERPSKLFVGAEVLLTIVLSRGIGQDQPNLFTTGFTKWAAEERLILFDRISYSLFEIKPKPFVIPKFMAATESEILFKMTSDKGMLGKYLLHNSEHLIYYRIGGGRYWKIFTNFQPKFILNGAPAISSRENYLYLDSEQWSSAVISLLSSSLFYWYFILTTNCRDLNPTDLNEFPINLDTVVTGNLETLSTLCSELMLDYEMKSEMKEKTSKLTGDIVYQEFYPRLSKPIIDQIDQVLAKHYGFSDEELDFIINYDIKYRMGRGADDDNE